MNKEIIEKIQTLFFECLNTKNSWGKNEIKELYKDCELKILREFIN